MDRFLRKRSREHPTLKVTGEMLGPPLPPNAVLIEFDSDGEQEKSALPPLSKPLPPSSLTITRLKLIDAECYYIREVFPGSLSQSYFTQMASLPNWAVRPIMMFGKLREENRESAVFAANPGANYRYSGRDNFGDPVPLVIGAAQRRVEEVILAHEGLAKLFPASVTPPLFNFVLANKYNDGNQSIGMHSDDERGLDGPIVAASFGAVRKFVFKHRLDPEIQLKINLESGSVLIMTGKMQRVYKHGIPVEKTVCAGRISLTFRRLKANDKTTTKTPPPEWTPTPTPPSQWGDIKVVAATAGLCEGDTNNDAMPAPRKLRWKRQ